MLKSCNPDLKSNKEPWLALILSLLYPGIGHIYASRLGRGVSLFACTIFLYMAGFWSLISTNCSVIISWLISVVIFILTILACVDALNITRSSNSASFESTRKSNKDTWLAVFLSIVLPCLGYAYLRRWLYFILFGLGFFLFFVAFQFISENNILQFIIQFTFRVIIAGHTYYIAPIKRVPTLKVTIKNIMFFILIGCLGRWGVPLLVKHYFFINTKVITHESCMAPTIRFGDYIIISKIAYSHDTPKLGDVIAFKLPEIFENRAGELAIKRLVASGGEEVWVEEGRLYVNGKERKFDVNNKSKVEFYANDEPFYQDTPKNLKEKAAAKVYYVPEGHYFLLGDNISHSVDSRFFGSLPRGQVIGKVIKIYWPPNNAKLLYEKNIDK